MARKSKRDWLEEGMHALVESGVDALTIDALTQRMGVTKGSFYHHFTNHDAFLDALLTFWEEEGVLNIIEHMEKLPTASEKLMRLLEITTAEPYVAEIAFRAWALRDPRAKVVQARIDQERIEYLKMLCREIVSNVDQADRVATLLYLTYVGGQQIGLDPSVIQTLYREIIQSIVEITP